MNISVRDEGHKGYFTDFYYGREEHKNRKKFYF